MKQHLIQALCLVGGIVFGILATLAVGPGAAATGGDTVSLDGKTGAELDRAYVEAMISELESNVEMSQTVLAQSEDEKIRYLAAEIISVQSDEIGMMREWIAKWYSDEQ